MARHFLGGGGGGGVMVTTSLRAWARKDSSFTRYFPSKASRNLRYVLSQNIPEPGASSQGRWSSNIF